MTDPAGRAGGPLDSKTKFNGVGGSEAHIGNSARLLPRPALLNYRLQLPRAGAVSLTGAIKGGVTGSPLLVRMHSNKGKACSRASGPFLPMLIRVLLKAQKSYIFKILSRSGTCWLVNVGAIRNGSFSHEHYSSSHSKTLRAAMGCSVRFAGSPGRTKERRIERLAGQYAPHGKRKTSRVEAEGEVK
jgi:hypothetical protein